MNDLAATVSHGAAERETGGAEQATDVARAAAQAERQRLARDIHDSITQTLISLRVAAETAANRLDTQPAQAREALDLVRHLAIGATTELRALLMDLHDTVLEQYGLVAALEAYCEVVRQRSGLQVDLNIVGRGRRPGLGAHGWADGLPAAYQEALYRLVQEALANVVKHARATRATVTLACERTVRLRVEDNGIGFGTPAPAHCYGLASMRDRVKALGGRVHLDNVPGGGARVAIEIPAARPIRTPTR